MLKLFDTVRLKENNEELGISTDVIGAIVDIQGNGEAITVDFLVDDDKWEDLIFHLFSEDELVLVKP